jgi:RNA polymerase sigma factor (sigma-70 family)
MLTPERATDPHRAERQVDEIDAATIRLLQLSRDRATAQDLPAPTVAEAWCRVYEACNPWIRAIIRRHSGLQSSHEDQAQDIWVAVVSGIPQYDADRGPLRVWVARVAHNVLCTQGRERRQLIVPVAEAEPPIAARERDPADQCDVHLKRERIASALRALQSHVSATTYQIILKRWIDQASFQQIAISVRLSEKQVRDRHYRALAKLRRLYVGCGHGS